MTARLAGFLTVVTVLLLVAGTMHLLGGTDGRPLEPEPPKHEAVQAAGARASEARFFLIVERQLAEEAARAEQERLAAVRAAEEARKRRAATERRTVTRTTQAHTGASGDIWHSLAMCETGGTMNQRATSRTGRYLGYFQFDLDSYRRAGGSGDPRDDSWGEQLRVAKNWQRLVGWGAWPTCARRLGLL